MDKEWEDGDDAELENEAYSAGFSEGHEEGYDKGYNEGYRQAIMDRQASKKKLGKLRRETYQSPSKRKGKHSA